MISNIATGMMLQKRIIQPPLIAVTGYFSTMAIFFLLYCTIWKRTEHRNFFIFSNVIALIMSVTAFFMRTPFILPALQFILLVFSVALIFGKRHKKVSHIRPLYLLLLVFWLVNMFVVGPRRLVPFQAKIVFQLISLAVFYAIYYKVSKWTK